MTDIWLYHSFLVILLISGYITHFWLNSNKYFNDVNNVKILILYDSSSNHNSSENL